MYWLLFIFLINFFLNVCFTSIRRAFALCALCLGSMRPLRLSELSTFNNTTCGVLPEVLAHSGGLGEGGGHESLYGKEGPWLSQKNIVLIPKVQGLEIIGNYRPISLCNSVYKIISKIIVALLKSHLDTLVAPYQAAFVSRRRGVDNIIIVQELIHSISKSKGKKMVHGHQDWSGEGLW